MAMTDHQGNIVSGKYIAGASPCRRNLNVENATNDLEGAVDGLREAVEALESHLAPLLASERPSALGEDRCRGDSEVAERILCNADSVRSRSARIRELIDRL